MERLSRYTDTIGRTLVVIARWSARVDGHLVPTNVDILILEEERMVQYPVADFKKWIDNKLITQIQKN